eukprot:UN10228
MLPIYPTFVKHMKKMSPILMVYWKLKRSNIRNFQKNQYREY